MLAPVMRTFSTLVNAFATSRAKAAAATKRASWGATAALTSQHTAHTTCGVPAVQAQSLTRRACSEHVASECGQSCGRSGQHILQGLRDGLQRALQGGELASGLEDHLQDAHHSTVSGP